MTVAALGGLLFWFAQFATEAPGTALLPLLDLVVGVGAVVATHWRRRWPAAVAWLTTLATSVSAMAAVASAIAYISLVTTRRWRVVAPVSLVGLGAAYVYELLNPAVIVDVNPLPWWALLAFTALFTTIALVAGLYIGARRELVDSFRERAETAEREQAARVEQARMGERARIAREMHDVLAHRISLVSLHAGAMTYRTDLAAEELRSSARVVQENAQLALSDLRGVLGVLRDTHQAAPSAAPPPQPTLADLPALLDETRAAGTPVQVTSDLAGLSALPDTVGRTAYRIIQEALTNARKHAPGTPTVMRAVGVRGGQLELEVTNLLPATAPEDHRPDAATGQPGGGVGLVGLTERAVLAGGRLEHGAIGGRYCVRAWLPWPV